MKGMILAAGFGTRLRPITYSTPKPLVPLCNQPLIAYAVDAFLAAEVRDLIVNLHHLPEAIEQYLDAQYGERANVHLSYEPEILGTGGAIRKVRSLLETEVDFFLVNGDTIQSPPFANLRDARRRRDALATLSLREPPEDDRFTPVWFEHGAVTGFGEGEGEALMFSGSHCISSRVFRYLPDQEFSGIIDEVYQPVIDGGREVIAGVLDRGFWFDVGTPRRYLEATKAVWKMMRDGSIAVPAGSQVERTSLVGHESIAGAGVTESVIGARSRVEGVAKASIIWDDCHLGEDVRLENCIVTNRVKILRPLQLKNAVICPDAPTIPRVGPHRVEEGLVIAGFR